MYDCQYQTGFGTSFNCIESNTYCFGSFPIRLGSSVDYSYRRCTDPSCGANASGLKQCESFGARLIDYNCGGSNICFGTYSNGGYSKTICHPGGASGVDYYDCCSCEFCS